MTTYRIKPQFIMAEEDINFLTSLPANLPSTKLTAKQITQIKDIYYKYLSKNQVYYSWSVELYQLEQKERWAGGIKIKTHEAMRIVLDWLVDLQADKEMNADRAAEKFFYSLTNREASTILLYKIYEQTK